MLNIADIGLLSPNLSAAAASPARAREIATEFDALVLEMLLQQSGLLRALSPEQNAHLPLISEMFVQHLAHQLATQMDLGFGSLLISQAITQSNRGENP